MVASSVNGECRSAATRRRKWKTSRTERSPYPLRTDDNSSFGNAWPSRLARVGDPSRHEDMRSKPNTFILASVRGFIVPLVIAMGIVAGTFAVLQSAEPKADAKSDWRVLPLIADGKVSPDWVHTGWGTFVVDDG